MENKKWYAVQEHTSDGWDNGSFDFEEAKAMLKKQGYGLIAVIVDDFCEEEIWFDDLFYLPNFENDELAAIVRNADNWIDTGCMDAMNELCDRAGRKLRDMVHDGKDCSELFQELRRCTSENFLAGTPDVSDDQEDLTDWLIYGAEQADALNLAYCLEKILDVDLGI